MTQITMPKMSDTMEEGRIVRWLKHEGDSVTEGEPVAEIETDKANVEMESFQSGVLQQILVQEGETIPVGEPIAVMQKEGEAAAPTAPVEAAAPPAEEAPQPAPTPPVEAPTPTVEAERLRVSPLARKLAA
ncbi:MAG: 2-oxo acid dehydrogenase subunit E2, partial [Armatimonadetes bacterium]|nr:2-oxo acid dehydrogenase subunit E2 [Armatimonadota bacterium]